MKRPIVAVVVGYAVWTTLWLGGGAGIRAGWPDAFPEQGPWSATVPLAVLLALSVTCSLAAGASAAAIALGRPVLVMATLLLATGIAVQASVWSWMPLWFHLAFLAAIVPVCLIGGSLRART